MARTRLLHPDGPLDEDVAHCSIWARYVFAHLPCHADREGRLADKPFTLKLEILPTDDVDMDKLLQELHDRRLIFRYQADGKRCIQIRTFLCHQHPHKNEPQSFLPPPPTDSRQIASTRIPIDVPTGDPDPVCEGEIDPVKTTRAVARPRSPNAFESTLAELAAAWSAQYGTAYKPTPADRSQLGRLLRSLAPEEAAELPALYRSYLADNDPFIAEKHRHSISYFCASGGVNKYRTTPRVAGTSQRDLGNAAAFAKFGKLAFGGKP